MASTSSDPRPNRDEIVAFAQEAFGYLEDDRHHRLEISDAPWRTLLAYVGNPLTFEVELDWRDACAFVLVCRTVDGRRPPGYYMHEGRLIRIHLSEALVKGRSADHTTVDKLRHVTRGSGASAMKTQIVEYSAALRMSYQQLASGHEPPNAIG